MAIGRSGVSGPTGVTPIQPVTMRKVREVARQWILTRSLAAVETEWIALLYAERRAGRLSNQASGGANLKALLAPFKQGLEELRETVRNASNRLGGTSGGTGHGVYSKARSLPVGGGGGPGGEPEPPMGAPGSLGAPASKDEDDDEVVDRLTYLARKILGTRK